MSGPLPAGPRPPALRPLVRKAYAEAAARAATVLPGKRVRACTPHSGLGCGSPTAIAYLTPGEWVLDLGSGAGFDCLAAAVEVGSRGRVVGVDLTPEMVRLARRHAKDAGVGIVHFLQAEIESLPFPDASFDVVMSNCVINLCSDKARIFAEACRVLKPCGRLAAADIVALAPLPDHLHDDIVLHTGCITGATRLEELAPLLLDAGFTNVEIDAGPHRRALVDSLAPHLTLERFLAAANIIATKTG